MSFNYSTALRDFKAKFSSGDPRFVYTPRTQWFIQFSLDGVIPSSQTSIYNSLNDAGYLVSDMKLQNLNQISDTTIDILTEVGTFHGAGIGAKISPMQLTQLQINFYDTENSIVDNCFWPWLQDIVRPAWQGGKPFPRCNIRVEIYDNANTAVALKYTIRGAYPYYIDVVNLDYNPNKLSKRMVSFKFNSIEIGDEAEKPKEKPTRRVMPEPADKKDGIKPPVVDNESRTEPSDWEKREQKTIDNAKEASKTNTKKDQIISQPGNDTLTSSGGNDDIVGGTPKDTSAVKSDKLDSPAEIAKRNAEADANNKMRAENEADAVAKRNAEIARDKQYRQENPQFQTKDRVNDVAERNAQIARDNQFRKENKEFMTPDRMDRSNLKKDNASIEKPNSSTVKKDVVK